PEQIKLTAASQFDANAINTMVQRCLKKDVEQRFQFVAELHQAISLLQLQEPRRTAPYLILILLSVIVVGSLIFFFVKSGLETSPEPKIEKSNIKKLGASIGDPLSLLRQGRRNRASGKEEKYKPKQKLEFFESSRAAYQNALVQLEKKPDPY